MKLSLIAPVLLASTLFACASNDDSTGASSSDVVSARGEACGTGVTAIAVECGSGFVCADESKAHPDQLGECVRDRT